MSKLHLSCDSTDVNKPSHAHNTADQPARMQHLYPNGSQAQIYYEKDHFPHPIWQDEEMHDLLVKSAMAAAAAISSSGRPIRTGQHVMLRIDLILTGQGDQVNALFCMPGSYSLLAGIASKVNALFFMPRSYALLACIASKVDALLCMPGTYPLFAYIASMGHVLAKLLCNTRNAVHMFECACAGQHVYGYRCNWMSCLQEITTRLNC